MDKNDYKLQTNQMLEFMEKGEYRRAASIADEVDWKRVRNVMMLTNVSDIYEKTGQFQKSYEILKTAYHRAEGSRKIIYKLSEMALKTGNADEAIDYYDEFVQIAPKDPDQYILKYRILRAQNAPLEQQIDALEEFKKSEYIEEWAYELALRYREAGMTAECLEECDDLILWFSEGQYVYKAMELKMRFKPLTASQQAKYDRRRKNTGISITSDETAEMPDIETFAAASDEPAKLTSDATVELASAADAVSLTEAAKSAAEITMTAEENTAEEETAGIGSAAEEAGSTPGLEPEEEEAFSIPNKIGETMRLDEALKKLLHPEMTEKPEQKKESEEAYAADLAEEIAEIESVVDLDMVSQMAKEKEEKQAAAKPRKRDRRDMQEIVLDDELLDVDTGELSLEKLFAEELGREGTLAETAAEELPEEELLEGAAEELTEEELLEGAAEELTEEELLEGAAEEITGEELLEGAAEELTEEELLEGAAEEITGEELLEGAAEELTGEELLEGAAEELTEEELLEGAAEELPEEELLKGAAEELPEEELLEGAAEELPEKELLEGADEELPAEEKVEKEEAAKETAETVLAESEAETAVEETAETEAEAADTEAVEETGKEGAAADSIKAVAEEIAEPAAAEKNAEAAAAEEIAETEAEATDTEEEIIAETAAEEAAKAVAAEEIAETAAEAIDTEAEEEIIAETAAGETAKAAAAEIAEPGAEEEKTAAETVKAGAAEIAESTEERTAEAAAVEKSVESDVSVQESAAPKEEDQIDGQMSLEDLLAQWSASGGADEEDTFADVWGTAGYTEEKADTAEPAKTEETAEAEAEEETAKEGIPAVNEEAESEAADQSENPVEAEETETTAESAGTAAFPEKEPGAKKEETPILPPEIQRLIDEIEGVIPREDPVIVPEKKEEEKPRSRRKEQKVRETVENKERTTQRLHIDDIASALEDEDEEEIIPDTFADDFDESFAAVEGDFLSGDETEFSEDLAEEAAEEFTEEFAEKAAEELTEEFAEEAAEELAEDAAEEYAEEFAEEAAEELAEEFAEEAAEEFAEDTAEEYAEEFAEDAAEEYAEEFAEDAAEEFAEEFAEDAAEEYEDDGAESEQDYAGAAEEYDAESADDAYAEEPAGALENAGGTYDYFDDELPDFEDEFRIRPGAAVQPDDREIPDEDEEIDILSATTPLSRKETAKLIATGKTSPLPVGELSDALSLSNTGFVVHGRYDLETQSGIGTRAGLTDEQKKLFSYFVPVRGMSEQLVDVLEQDKNCTNRKGTSKTGNLLIIGDKGNGKTVLAVDVVKAIHKQRGGRAGKVAIINGEALNKKRIGEIFQKLYGGALIIEKAGSMSERTVAKLNKAMEQDTGELLIVLEEQRKPLDRLLSSNRDFRRKFTSRLEVPIFINDELVTFAQAYAKENGYRIDEMGILALYSCIDSMQREDHAVTVAEVKEVMDAAIQRSQKASAKKLVKKMFGKNTDSADRIILSEKDFTI